MTPSYASAAAASSGGRRAVTFAGASVFLSRNLVAPEVFDALHDALRLNGAEVFLCADPGRTGPLDFHVISSSSHERFADLRAKGCNLLGPQCILSCAKERRFLPKQCYTCCLAMDGVKILCSGFEKDEKAKIEQFVTAMGGLLQTKVSMDVNFVIAKDVLAAKYKVGISPFYTPELCAESKLPPELQNRLICTPQLSKPDQITPSAGFIGGFGLCGSHVIGFSLRGSHLHSPSSITWQPHPFFSPNPFLTSTLLSLSLHSCRRRPVRSPGAASKWRSRRPRALPSGQPGA